MRTSLAFSTTSREPSLQGSFALRGYDYEEVPDENIEAPLSEPFPHGK